MILVDRVARNILYIARSTEAPHITQYNPVSLLLLFLPFILTAVYGAYLQYGSTRLFDSPSNVTLTVGMRVNVSCVQATGPVPTSIEWYNPQGQLVSRDGGDAVNQQAGGGGRIAYLNFQSYRQSQGGKYECRGAGLGNNTERLSVCIGERYTILLTVQPATCDHECSFSCTKYHTHTMATHILVTRVEALSQGVTYSRCMFTRELQ